MHSLSLFFSGLFAPINSSFLNMFCWSCAYVFFFAVVVFVYESSASVGQRAEKEAREYRVSTLLMCGRCSGLLLLYAGVAWVCAFGVNRFNRGVNVPLIVFFFLVRRGGGGERQSGGRTQFSDVPPHTRKRRGTIRGTKEEKKRGREGDRKVSDVCETKISTFST